MSCEMGQGWTVNLLTFVGGTSRLVNRKRLEEKVEELQVLKSAWTAIQERLIRKLADEQDTVHKQYYAAKLGRETRQGKEDVGKVHIGRDGYMRRRGE